MGREDEYLEAIAIDEDEGCLDRLRMYRWPLNLCRGLLGGDTGLVFQEVI